MQARGFLNYGLKYCWPKVFYCICQPNELEQEIMKKLGGGQPPLLESPLRTWGLPPGLVLSPPPSPVATEALVGLALPNKALSLPKLKHETL